MEVFHSDYRDVDGLKLPFSLHGNIDGKKAIQMTVREWKFNSSLDDSLFSKQSAKKEGFHIDLSGFNETAEDLVIIHKVEPVYPELVMRARVSGQVVLRITIDEAGLVQEVVVIDGHRMLIGAAVEAVRQWRYRPTVKDGNAVFVNTLVTVNFEIGS